MYKYKLLLIANRKFRLIHWPVNCEDQGNPTSVLCYISHNLNLNHVSASHVTSSRLSLGLRVYSSPLFFDPVSSLMAYQHKPPMGELVCIAYSNILILILIGRVLLGNGDGSGSRVKSK
jgi:hypothetical protein